MPWWRSSLIFTARKWVASTGIAPALSAGEADLLCSFEDKAKLVDETGFAPARAFAHEFLRLACIHSTTRRKMVRTEGVAPSRAFAHRLLGPRVFCSTTSAKLEHPQGRAPCSLPYQGSPSLSTGWMQKWRSGRNRTFVAPEGGAFTARCNCCSATLRCMGARAGIAPATISL